MQQGSFTGIRRLTQPKHSGRGEVLVSRQTCLPVLAPVDRCGANDETGMTITCLDGLFGLKAIGSIAANTMYAMAADVGPGMTARELDGTGPELLARKGASGLPM